MKRLQLAQLFTHTDKFDRFLGDRFDGYGCTTAGITIHFGQDHAADVKLVIKGLGNVDRILSGHGIGNQQDVSRCNRRLDALEFAHEGFIDMQPSGCIEQQGVTAFLLRSHAGPLTDIHRVHVCI